VTTSDPTGHLIHIGRLLPYKNTLPVYRRAADLPRNTFCPVQGAGKSGTDPELEKEAVSYLKTEILGSAHFVPCTESIRASLRCIC